MSLVGSTLGRFRVDRLLGRGGMGVVYAAFDEKLERDVALKVLNEEGDFSLQKKRLLREARLAAKLTHPNIATVYEVDELDTHLYIVMEMLEGAPLRKILMQRRMGIDEAVSVARDMARALSKAHAADIIHRDIKPENVFVTTPSPDAILAKVLDFGLARQRPQLAPGMTRDDITSTDTTSRGDMWGTPGYVSPEQAHGHPLDVRTDIFSFGVVLYEMLAGIKPFRGDNPIAIMIATTKVEPKPLREIIADIRPELEEIVRRCMKKDREQRYKNGAELSAALEAYVRGSSISTKNSIVGSSSPNLPLLSDEDLGQAATIQSDPLMADNPDNRTTGGSAAIEMLAREEDGPPPSLEQQRTDHMKLVAAISSGVAMALVLVIIGVSWATPSKHKKRTSAAGHPTTSAVASNSEPPPPPTTIVAPTPTDSAATADMGDLDPEPTTPPTGSQHPVATAHPVIPGKAVQPVQKRNKPADCAQPFTTDAKGIKIPKLHCL